MRLLTILAALTGTLAPVAVPVPAFAQAESLPEDNVFDGDHVTIGAGAIYGPSYDGSDDYVVTPIPMVRAKIGGIEISPRAGGIAVDLIPDNDRPRIGFSLGPLVSYSANRARQIKDPVVRAAGKLDEALELGATAGVTLYRVLHEYDSITASADIKWDVLGAHGGRIISPGVSYFTPLSRAAFVSLALSAKHVDDDYADYYYDVTPAQSAASGLPLYDAKGGWDSWSVGLFGGYDLSGNALDGGFAVFGVASYSRMLNDGKRTPYTSIRGDANQWVVGAGIGYTF